MSSRRTLKAAEAIREVVSMAILTELRDPRVRDVTVTYVEVAPDMRSAKIHVSIMGNESRQNLSLKGLQNSAGFLQQRIADRIDTRYTPRLQFVLDKGVKNSIAVSRILDEVLGPNRKGPEAAGEADDASPIGGRPAAPPAPGSAAPEDLADEYDDEDFEDDEDFDEDDFDDFDDDKQE